MANGTKPLFKLPRKFKFWFLEGIREKTVSPNTATAEHAKHHVKPWWQVMCLTGVDYFSTLGYQPYLAFLAAGALAPLATVFLVLLTLFGALPMYFRVAQESPSGQGSVSMLEHLLPGWRGKTFVLCLLGFAATDFVITMTLSAADATEHIVKNPLVPHWMDHQMGVTILLLLLLGAVFLKGFSEAIFVAVGLTVVFLVLNTIVVTRGLYEIATHPAVLGSWKEALITGPSHGNIWLALGLSLIVFPKLALGLSGFETGVTVMPLIKGEITDTSANPAGRIRNAKKLLTVSALIMSTLLIGSSLVVTMLIPAKELQTGGEASGRALAYLAHHQFGNIFGTIYDISTAAILWYAGASAMAGLLNLVPRYLPRYGMAPEWARANRPLVVVITTVTLVVTYLFNASVEAQGAAYATGVLMLMLSASVAVVISIYSKERGWKLGAFIVITLVFAYTTVQNVHERPEGLKICAFFIVAIIGVSLFSRALRVTELRIKKVELDAVAERYVREAVRNDNLRVAANRVQAGDDAEYFRKRAELQRVHRIRPDEPVLIFEVNVVNPSDFSDDTLHITATNVGKHRILRCESPAVPNAIAAFLIHAQKLTGVVPDAYFGWTEGSPVTYAMKYLFFGEGDTAPVVHEVLRQAVDKPEKRPRVHVG